MAGAGDKGRRVGVGLAAMAVVAVLGLLGLAAVEPGFVALVLPFGLSSGRALQLFGGLMILVPSVAAVMAHRQGRARVAGWFVVLIVLAGVPAVVLVQSGADRVRQASTSDEPEPCAERSGGGNRCPGG